MGELCADGEGGFSDGGVLVVSGLRVPGGGGCSDDGMVADGAVVVGGCVGEAMTRDIASRCGRWGWTASDDG